MTHTESRETDRTGARGWPGARLAWASPSSRERPVRPPRVPGGQRWGTVGPVSAAAARSMPLGTVDRGPATCSPFWAPAAHLLAAASRPGGRGTATMCLSVTPMGRGRPRSLTRGTAPGRGSRPAPPKPPPWKGLGGLFTKDPDPWGRVPGARAPSALSQTRLCSFSLTHPRREPDAEMRVHRHHLPLKRQVDPPCETDVVIVLVLQMGKLRPPRKISGHSQGRVRAGIGTQGRPPQSQCLPPTLTGLQRSPDGEPPPTRACVVKWDSTALACGLTEGGRSAGTCAGETSWAYGVLSWEAGNKSGSTRLKISRTFWRVRRASARWRVVEDARPRRGRPDGQRGTAVQRGAPWWRGAPCRTFRHLGPPATRPFVVWLRQTSGLAGRFLNGPWKEVTPFPCRRH